MEAETARVTLFDGGDIMYGNHVRWIAGSLDSIDGVRGWMPREGVREGVEDRREL